MKWMRLRQNLRSSSCQTGRLRTRATTPGFQRSSACLICRLHSLPFQLPTQQRRDPRPRSPHHVLLIEPRETHHFVDVEYFLIAARPSETHQVIENGLGRKPRSRYSRTLTAPFAALAPVPILLGCSNHLDPHTKRRACRRAYSQQKSAVRSPPICKNQSDCGANRVPTGINSGLATHKKVYKL